MKIQFFWQNAHSFFKKPVKIIGVLALLFCKNMYAQLPHLWHNTELTDSTQKWSVAVDSKSFLHNREYFGTIENGYTLFGQQLQLIAQYSPQPKLTIKAGIFGSKDFGNNKFTNLMPYYSVAYNNTNVKNSSQFIFGNLNANLSHNLIEPLYAFENNISQTLENGIQYIFKNKNNNLDIWIDWQKMIYQKSNFQEEIWGGLSYEAKVFINPTVELSIPIQLSIKHNGGQINIGSEPVVNQMAFATGAKAKLKQNTTIQYYYVASKNDISPQISDFLKSGSGHYFQASTTLKNTFLALNYYKSLNFYHFNGSDVFQNSSKYDSNIYQNLKSILLFRINYEKQLVPKLWLSLRFEPYFDFTSRKFNHSQGLFFRYKEVFGIKK